jgi:hypothetical protein
MRLPCNVIGLVEYVRGLRAHEQGGMSGVLVEREKALRVSERGCVRPRR